MSRTAGRCVPKYSKHKSSGQAVVTIGGVDHYLGPHGTEASRAEYDRLVAQWMANGRRHVVDDDGLTLAELILRYREHVMAYYVKHGRPTSEQHDIAMALRPVRQLYSAQLVSEFGPLALKAVRLKMIETGYARSTINKNVHRIRRMFRWGVENELVNPSILQALESVAALSAS